MATALLLALLPAGASAAAIGVSNTADTPVGQACAGFTGCSLREAVTKANTTAAPDAINVQGGTYTLTNGDLDVTEDLEVVRVGAQPATVSGNDASRIFDVSGGTTDFTARFMTLTAGREVDEDGGAIRGGAGTTITVESTSISQSDVSGTGTRQGGAIYSQGPVTIKTADNSTTGSVITVNSASSASAGGQARGGAVAVEGATLTVGPRTTISNNSALAANNGTAIGGGVYASNGAAAITESTVIGNQASAGSAFGGGVGSAGAAVSLMRSTMSGNGVTGSGAQASGGGAIATDASGAANVGMQSSTLAENSAATTNPGGSAAGGAVLSQAGASSIGATNSTIAGNSVSGPGTKLGAGFSSAGPVTTAATILAENTGSSGTQCDGAGTITSGGYSVLGDDGSCGYAAGTGDVTGVTDAGLQTLGSNVPGLTQTIMLELGSPALDIVPSANALCTSPATDQRGIARPQPPGNPPQPPGNCDSGSVEARPATLTITPDPRNFADTVPGNTSNATVSISNSGDLAMGAAPNAAVNAPFAYSSGCSSPVAGGANCIMTLAFSPTALGGFSRTLTVTSGSLSDTATLNGTGVGRLLTVTTSGTGTGTVTGPGIDCGGAGHTDCTHFVADGAQVELTASPATGSSFTTFTGGGCGAASPCTVTLDADKSVDASFALVSTPPPGPDPDPGPTPGPAPDPTPDADPPPSGDRTPPQTTITNPPKRTRPRHTRFRFTSSEPGSTFTCRLDDRAPEACDRGKIDYPGLIRGRHEFSVFATDPAGNADPTPATHNFRVTAKKKKKR
jgi:hypothetical protein